MDKKNFKKPVIFRNGYPEVFFGKGVLEICSKFTGCKFKCKFDAYFPKNTSVYINPAPARVSCRNLLVLNETRCRAVNEKDDFLRTSLPLNVIIVKKKFLR